MPSCDDLHNVCKRANPVFGLVTATDNKLGCPTESLHGNRELRSSTATAGEVSPPRPGFWPKDLATAGTLPPADKSGRASSYQQQVRTYGKAMNFKRWADLEDEDDEGMDSVHFGLSKEPNLKSQIASK